MKKICNKCNIEKDIDCFLLRKDNGKYRNACKECNYKKQKEWKNNNAESSKHKYKTYRLEHIEIYKERDKLYYQKKKLNNYKPKKEKQTNEERKEKVKQYYLANKAKLQRKNYEWHKNKLKTDFLFKLVKNTRSMIYNSIKRSGYTKNTKTFEIIGCSYEEFKIYLESKFKDWMNWENYGKYNNDFNYGWDIDHIIPLSSAETEEELIKLNHFTNLQPLCSKVNRDIKRDIYEKSLTN
jgi:hypothetical protein